MIGLCLCQIHCSNDNHTYPSDGNCLSPRVVSVAGLTRQETTVRHRQVAGLGRAGLATWLIPLSVSGMPTNPFVHLPCKIEFLSTLEMWVSAAQALFSWGWSLDAEHGSQKAAFICCNWLGRGGLNHFIYSKVFSLCPVDPTIWVRSPSKSQRTNFRV